MLPGLLLFATAANGPAARPLPAPRDALAHPKRPRAAVRVTRINPVGAQDRERCEAAPGSPMLRSLLAASGIFRNEGLWWENYPGKPRSPAAQLLEGARRGRQAAILIIQAVLRDALAGLWPRVLPTASEKSGEKENLWFSHQMCRF